VQYVMSVVLALWCSWALAADPANDARVARQQEAQTVREAIAKAIIRGPAQVPLRDQAELQLPEHFGFIPQEEAAEAMRLMGNRTGTEFVGMIVPLPREGGGSNASWFVTLQYDPAGFIKDDDAQHWDSSKLLQTLQDGTEAANADRERLGIPPIAVTRWVQSPSYESGSHRLVWSAEAKRKDGSDTDPTINYNTYVLGREGYVSLNLITTAATVDRDRQAAGELLSGVDFKSGKRYGDFNSSTDKVAAYGLAALIAGVAIKKLGLLALFAATIAKFAKIIAIAVAAFGAGIVRWFKARLGTKQV
jgi:uncharacterized membrane-anchored protein